MGLGVGLLSPRGSMVLEGSDGLCWIGLGGLVGLATVPYAYDEMASKSEIVK